LLGVKVPEDEVAEIIEVLGLKIIKRDGNSIQVSTPSWRPDLQREVDLIEEVARIYGYDKIPIELKTRVGARKTKLERENRLYDMRHVLANMGFTEVMTWSIIEPDWMDLLDLNSDDYRRKLVFLAGQEDLGERAMTSSLIPHLLDVIRYNNARQCYDLRVFELNKVFWFEKGEAKEAMRLAIALSGRAWPIGLGVPDREVDLLELKGIWEVFRANICIDNELFDYYTQVSSPYYGANKLVISLKDEVIGEIGEVRADILAKWDIARRVVILDVDVEKLLALERVAVKYRAVSQFPAIRRDIALVVPNKVIAGEAERLIKSTGGELLERVVLFDRYEKLSEGSYGLAFALWFRSKEGTLREEEVDQWTESILNGLRTQLKIELRQ